VRPIDAVSLVGKPRSIMGTAGSRDLALDGEFDALAEKEHFDAGGDAGFTDQLVAGLDKIQPDLQLDGNGD
jgi:hypothetical protein